MTNCETVPVIYQPMLPESGGVDGYIRQVNAIPCLSKEEEYYLANEFLDKQNLQAAQRLVIAHLKYVVRVAKGYMGYGLPLNDLIQEGSVGLMKAVKRFMPNKGVRLVTFAMHWIKAEIHEFILKNWRIVKVATTKGQRKLFFKLRSSKKSLLWLTKEETIKIANDLGVKPSEVTQMEARLTASDTPFELSSDEDESDSRSFSPAQYLEDHSDNPELLLTESSWQSFAQEKLHQALDELDERSKDIVVKRWLREDDKATLSDLAIHYGVSKERIRQLENKAIRALQEAFSD